MPRPRSAARARVSRAALALGALAAICTTPSPAACAALADSASARAAPADSAAHVTPPDSAAAHAISPPAIGRPAEWDTLESGLPEEVRLRPIIRFRYNRVDGPGSTFGGAFQTARGSAPVLFGEVTHAASRERILYEAGFVEPLGDRPWLSIGGSVYRRTASEDGWIAGEMENTVFALFARTDYRDYYEAEGARGAAVWSPGTDFSVRADARFESQRSLAKSADFSLTGRHRKFRPNPAVQDGDEQVYAVQFRVGPGELPLRGGTHGDLTYERSGSPLQGNFEYGRLRGGVRSKIRISPSQDIRVRAIAGSTRSGLLPVQKIWHLGGIGTLRGHDYKVFDGDQFFLVNAEHYRRARKNLYAFAFFDYGAAWFGGGNLGRQRPALDGGLGLRLGEGPVAFTVAKNLRDRGSKPRVGVRLGGAF